MKSVKKFDICVCAEFSNSSVLTDGSATKTRNVYNFLEKHYRNRTVRKEHFPSWKRHFFSNLFRFLKMLKTSAVVIIMPNQSRLKIKTFLYRFFVKKNKAKIIYIAVGGWLPDFCHQHKYYTSIISHYLGVFVETDGMMNKLNSNGLNNVHLSPVFTTNVLSKNKFLYSKDTPLNVCTFSRVAVDKGILLAIDAVEKANATLGKEVFRLTVFGKMIESDESIITNHLRNSKSCNYGGILSNDILLDSLSSFFLLLFPTFFFGEGFPATLLESYTAGLPVIASNWKYNRELVDENVTGWIVEPKSIDAIVDKLIFAYKNVDFVYAMREKCFEKSREYSPLVAMKPVLKLIDDVFDIIGQ
jgi:glycosyltransferase involved in cell wall biosynthesis